MPPNKVGEVRIPLGWPLDNAKPTRKPVFSESRASSAIRHFLDYRQAIGYTGAAHLLSIARTGAGKGVSTIIPALLTYPGPVIVIDPKGENFLVTRRWRQDHLGQRIYAIDPFNELKKHREYADFESGHGIDVFDSLRRSKDIDKSDTASLARLMAGVDPSKSRDPFWDNSAQDLLSGIIQYVL
ncbi:MAG: hypothetical protein EOP84_21795, partial [Verrucomicrobiaceae bacterium]